MADFRKYPLGKDQNDAPDIELNGVYYPMARGFVALTKALIKKGVITRAEILAEL